jgi:hypothetical protein
MLPAIVWAGVLKGKVTDDKGAPLPYATVFLEGTTTGVNTNGKGDYELTVSPGLYKVICQYVGYKQSSYNLSVTGSEIVEHSFILKGHSLEMAEVVVHANSEDPAYEIIRQAIKKRKMLLEQVKSFQTGIYLKGVVRSRALPKKFMGQKVKDETDIVDSVGKGVLYLTEEDADYYSTTTKQKTIIHSVHESGNKNGVGFPQFPPVITFYDNNVNVFVADSRGFISPISDNALFYYRYKLLGEFVEQGHTIYKIKVTPRRAFEPCFSGNIYIVDTDFAIHSLNLTLVRKSGMDMLDTLRVDQLFLPLHKDEWVIKSQVMYFTLKIFGFDITANFVTVYNKQKVNEPIPDSVFADKVISAYDKTANKKDTSYWTDARPIPLESDEKRDFVSKDSLSKKLTSPEYRDSIRRKFNKFKPMGILIGGMRFNSKLYKNTYSFNSLLGLGDNMINYNIVEGVNLAPQLTWRHMVDTGKYLYGDAVVRYGFSNTHLNAIGRLYYMDRDRELLNKMWLYGIEGGKYVFQYNPENPVLPWYNTLEALLARQNDLKLYERWEGSAIVRHNNGSGLSWAVKASFQQRLPLENSSTYSFFKGSNEGFTPNVPPHLRSAATAWEKHNASLLWATISYKPGITFTQYPDYKVANNSSWPRFTLTYDKGIPGIFDSRTDFDKWKFNIQDEMKLRLFGSLKYNVGVGGFLNTNYVSIPDLIHLYGNRGIGLAAPYQQSFQFAQYYDFSNKEALYGEGHVEYQMKGLLSNKIPLLRQAQWYLVLGGNAFYANTNSFYTEAFVGINNIGFKVVRGLRVDFVQSWDSNLGRNSGIRFGLNLLGASVVNKSNPTHSEW